MSASDFIRRPVWICVAAAMLTCCSGVQSSRGAPGALPQRAVIPRHAEYNASWMMPEAKEIKKLLYVSDWDANDVEVYRYDTGEEVGTLSGVNQPDGQCVDKAGNVWITNLLQNYVVEYAHGGKNPIKTLSTDGPGVGCAIDPTTGNLAVVNFRAGSGSDIQVWEDASGTPVDYSNESACYEMWPPGYDNKGNLYAEAGTSGFLCELPAGGTSLAPVAFDHTINSPGGVMWDGKYLTLTDEAYKGGISTAIYRVKRTRGGLRVVSKTRIRDKQCGATVTQPFIVGNKNTPANHQEGTTVVGANPACYYFSTVNYWHYPRGGFPFNQVQPHPERAEGLSVSIKA